MISATTETADQLRLAVGRLARRLRTQSAGGLTPSQRSVLASLMRHGPLTMGRLADIEGISRPSITGIVGRLAERGLVRRVPDPTDGRQMLAEVTADGDAAVRRGREERTAFLVQRMERLDDEERDVLARAAVLMRRMVEEDR